MTRIPMVRFRVVHEFPDENSTHILQDFAEELWRENRGHSRWDIDIDAVDRSSHVIEFRVGESIRKRVREALDRLLTEHLLGARVRVETIDEP
jgi:hypothetical protein